MPTFLFILYQAPPPKKKTKQNKTCVETPKREGELTLLSICPQNKSENEPN